jgi:acetyl-CoA C-acetyltransferase
MEEVVIVSAARTAIGKFGKALNGIKVTSLGAAVIGGGKASKDHAQRR